MKQMECQLRAVCGLLLLACLPALVPGAERTPEDPEHAPGTADRPSPDGTKAKSTPKEQTGDLPAGRSVDLTETPHETFVARRLIAPSGTPRPGDPEYPRDFPEIEEREPAPSTGHGALRMGTRTLAPGDPEYDRRWPKDDPVEVAAGHRTDRSAIHTAALIPRFILGEGADEGDVVNWYEEPAAPSVAATAPKAVQTEPRKLPDNLDPKTRQRIEELQEQWRRRREGGHPDAATLQAEEATSPREQGLPIDQAHAAESTAHTALSALRGNKPLAEISGLVVDAEKHTPIPARIRIVDATGIPAETRLPDIGFWCNGRFRVPVVAGTVNVEVSAGRFCTTFTKNLAIPAGTSLPLEIPLLRPRFLRFEEEGWYQGDLDWAVRTRRGEQRLWTGTPPDTNDAALVARAEGLHIVGIGLPEPRADMAPRTPEEIQTEHAAFERQGLLVMTNFPGPQHSFCGCVLGVGVTEWSGIPRYMGDPRQSLMDAMDALHQGGGLTLFTELRGRRAVNPRTQLAGYFQRLRGFGFFEDSDSTSLLYAPAELPCDTVVGPTYDALAFDGSEAVEAIWFNLLSHGYSIPIVGAEGGSLEAGRAPFGQTFVKLGGPPTRETVLQACREGRSMVSFGPVVFAEVVERAKGPGDRLPADGRQLSLRIRGFSSLTESASLEGFDILRNGEVVYHEKCENGMTELYDFRFPLTEKRDAWYVVRMTEVLTKPAPARRQAWTNPIYFDTPGRQNPKPAQTRVHGTLSRTGGAPLAGSITILEPGKPDRECPVGLNGRFDLHMYSAGTLVFAAPGFDPLAWKPIQHPKVQRALGAIQTERNGTARRQLIRPTLFSEWRYLLADLSTDIELSPRSVSGARQEKNSADRPDTTVPGPDAIKPEPATGKDP